MRRYRRLGCSVLVLFTTLATAKDKKPTVPPYILSAHTVRVIVEPGAGMDVEEPRANQTAQDDVEKALIQWGRFEPVMQDSPADLVITVRKGHDRIAQPTIAGPRIYNRPAVIGPTNNGGRVGVEQGQVPDASQGPGEPGTADPSGVHPQVEVGGNQDTFMVYRGDLQDALNNAPAYRFIAKNGLHSPDVPAVTEFRKAIEETEKQINSKKKP